MVGTYLAWLTLTPVAGGAELGEESATVLPGWLDRPLGRVLSPGTLADAHAQLGGLEGCFDCHSTLEATPDVKCLTCHEEIHERGEQRIGFHGTLTGPCSTCHVEHRGRGADLLGLDPTAFNHDQATFPLLGAHRQVACDDCHRRSSESSQVERFHAIGIAHATCADCHRDVHGKAFLAERDCGACHRESTWRVEGLVVGRTSESEPRGFVHDLDAHFPLDGRHRDLPCAECHTEARRELEQREETPPGRGAPRACAGCHEDPHRAALESSCETCHSTAAWRGPDAPFDHAKYTRFALDPLHASFACETCHSDARFQAVSLECAGCHETAAGLVSGRFGEYEATPDPHVRTDCSDCHAETWEGTRLVAYQRACVRCHAPEYGSLLLTRKRLIDERVVQADAQLKRLELALRRGEAAPSEERLAALRSRIERLTETGLHHPDLAEQVLEDALDELAAERGVR